MERSSELYRALLDAFDAVPVHPPRKLRVLDIVKVPSLVATGRRAKVDVAQAGVLHHESPFCDRHLADSTLWCPAAARCAQRLAKSKILPVDIVIVDEEAEELVDRSAAVRQLRKEKATRGIVVKVVYGRLEAVCPTTATATPTEDDDDTDVPLGGNVRGASVAIAAEVLCVDKKGQVYELSQRMLLASADDESRDSCRARVRSVAHHRRGLSAFSNGSAP